MTIITGSLAATAAAAALANAAGTAAAPGTLVVCRGCLLEDGSRDPGPPPNPDTEVDLADVALVEIPVFGVPPAPYAPGPGGCEVLCGSGVASRAGAPAFARLLSPSAGGSLLPAALADFTVGPGPAPPGAPPGTLPDLFLQTGGGAAVSEVSEGQTLTASGLVVVCPSPTLTG